MIHNKSLFMDLLFSQNSISVHRILVQYLDSISCGVFLTELLNHYSRAKNKNKLIDNKWVYVPDKKIIKNICVTENELQTIKKELQNKNIIDVNNSMYYSINTNELYHNMEKFMQGDNYDSKPFDTQYSVGAK